MPVWGHWKDLLIQNTKGAVPPSPLVSQVSQILPEPVPNYE